MIETVKHHFIAGMAGTDENYPILEWDRGVAQSQRTLNMLLPCRISPKFSADAFPEGQHDYNAVPFPPLGWRMLIFEGPEKRSSWGLVIEKWFNQTNYVRFIMRIDSVILNYFVGEKADNMC